jgi:hypothetical protein
MTLKEILSLNSKVKILVIVDRYTPELLEVINEDDILEKPYTPTQLLIQISQILDR